MPIYEYVCADCAHKQEAFRTISSRDEAPRCTACAAETKRVPSVAAPQVKLHPLDLQKKLKKRSQDHSAKLYKEEGVEIERSLAKRYTAQNEAMANE